MSRINGLKDHYKDLLEPITILLDDPIVSLPPKVLSSLSLKLKYLVDRVTTHDNLVALLEDPNGRS